MDIYLLMAWRDARLFNPYDKPILVKVMNISEGRKFYTKIIFI